MLIPFHEIQPILAAHAIPIHGALHIGAHECEEFPFYTQLGIKPENLVWVDALPEKVQQAAARGIPNVYGACVTDMDDQEVVFHVSNNGESSSILEFGTHSETYPGIAYTSELRHQSITIDTFFKRTGLDASKYTVWNFDIQGAELMALKGAEASLRYARAIYLEVNVQEVYKGCGLLGEIDSFLEARGFTRVLTKLTNAGWGDALYIKRLDSDVSAVIKKLEMHGRAAAEAAAAANPDWIERAQETLMESLIVLEKLKQSLPSDTGHRPAAPQPSQPPPPANGSETEPHAMTFERLLQSGGC